MPQANTKQNLAVAIEILTAMYSDPRSVDFALERIEAIEDERGKQGIMEAFSGLLQLAVYGAAELGRSQLCVARDFDGLRAGGAGGSVRLA